VAKNRLEKIRRWEGGLIRVSWVQRTPHVAICGRTLSHTVSRCFFAVLGYFLIGAQSPSAIEVLKAAALRNKPGNPTAPAPSYCGICSFYRALQALNRNVPFEQLLRSDYVGSRRGSSLSELQQAARDHGLWATPIHGMTCAMLAQVPCPAILHVKSAPGPNPVYHWILFLGTERGKARIYDAAHDCELRGFDELRASWDGSAVLVSDRPAGLLQLWSIRAAELLFLAGMVLCLMGGMRLIATRLNLVNLCSRSFRPRIFLGQVIMIAAVASGAALIAYVWNPTEGAFHVGSIERIQEAHFAGFLPRVHRKALDRLIGKEGVTLIDARLAADFRTGHIAGAQSIPVNAPAADVEDALRSIPHSNSIVIYCQSKDCPFSGVVAQKVFKRGYHDLSIYAGGWLEWSGAESDLTSQERVPKSPANVTSSATVSGTDSRP
jgi:rhodanese-related sulfurtransferase